MALVASIAYFQRLLHGCLEFYLVTLEMFLSMLPPVRVGYSDYIALLTDLYMPNLTLLDGL